MKVKILSLLAASLILTGGAGAEYYAGAGYGISWNGGHAWTEGVKYNYEKFSGMTSLFGGAVIPTEYLDLRAEGEFLHFTAKPKTGKSRQMDTAIANLVGVIPNVDLPVQPYVGVGLGYGRWDHKYTVVKQFITGVEYDLEEHPLGFALEYKHLSPNETGGKGDHISKINTDTLMLKVKYLF